MRLLTNLLASLFSCCDCSDADSPRAKERAIDASMRFATLSLFKSALVWFAVSMGLGLIASIQLHSPEFLAGCSIATYGKVSPAFHTALIYGALFNAGIGVGAWMLARLGGRPISNTGLLTVSSIAWNAGVTLALIGIFKGDQLPYQWFAFPAYVAPFLWFSFIGMGVWAALAFRERVYRSNYASQWYLLAGFFAFAWVFTAASVMLHCNVVSGSFQALANSWYVGNLFGLTLAPVAFAAIYYLLPKALGTPVVGYRYSGGAFWGWMLASAFSGVAAMAGGPVSAWVPSLGIIATFALLLPLTTLSIQFLSTLIVGFKQIWETLSMRFVAFGCVAFLMYGCFAIYGSLRGVTAVTKFTTFDSGVQALGLLGFVGMTLTGAIYFILPRILNKAIPVPGLADIQFWVQGLGALLVVIGLTQGGLQQGALLNGSIASADDILRSIVTYQFMTTMGMVFLVFSSIAFLVNFTWMLFADGEEKDASEELIQPSPELEYTAP